MGIDHIAYATRSTDKTLEVLSVLGFEKILFYKEPLDIFGSYISKVQLDTGQVLEIVEPKTDKSVVSRFVQDKQAMIYHTAFFTPHLWKTLEQLKALGAIVLTEPMDIPYPISPLHTQYKASHIFHPHIGVFEITGFEVSS